MIIDRNLNIFHPITEMPPESEIVLGKCEFEDEFYNKSINFTHVYVLNKAWQPEIFRIHLVAWRYLTPEEKKVAPDLSDTDDALYINE